MQTMVVPNVWPNLEGSNTLVGWTLFNYYMCVEVDSKAKVHPK
jgi:hypothetical protein